MFPPFRTMLARSGSIPPPQPEYNGKHNIRSSLTVSVPPITTHGAGEQSGKRAPLLPRATATSTSPACPQGSVHITTHTHDASPTPHAPARVAPPARFMHWFLILRTRDIQSLQSLSPNVPSHHLLSFSKSPYGSSIALTHSHHKCSLDNMY